jgi:hypothetical protein
MLTTSCVVNFELLDKGWFFASTINKRALQSGSNSIFCDGIGSELIPTSYSWRANPRSKPRLAWIWRFTRTFGCISDSFIIAGQGNGGPGNTGDFSSFALAIDGQDISALPGFRYHLGYTHLGNDTALASDESRFAIGAEYHTKITDKIGIGGVVEYVNCDNADGTNDQDRFYLTGGVQATYDSWNM